VGLTPDTMLVAFLLQALPEPVDPDLMEDTDMKCPKCQAENREERKFCGECGRNLVLSCSQCGFQNLPGEKFCGECGQSLKAPGPVPTEAPPAAQPQVPKFLAERILAVRDSIVGERKQVTVLFADIKGSMELIGDRDPEEARTLMESVLKLMMESVHQYEGTVNQVMGDGIMALFGAPLAQEDHALRGCYAALRMQNVIRQHSEELRHTQGVEVQVRVGLNSGEVVVGTIGSDLRMEYTAVGQTTHLAARMEQLATPGTIRITRDTFRLVEGRVQVQPLGPVPAKGLPQPIEVYELTGAGLTRSRFQAMTSRGLSRFVGRTSEFEILGQALKSAGQGQGQLVAAVGEPGVGKSRLCYEFTHSPMVRGWLILAGASVSYGKATTYLPLADLLRGYFGIHDGDGPRSVREKVTGKLLTLDHALMPAIPPILGILDVPTEDSVWEALLPAQRRQRTLESVKHVLLRESQVQPLLVVFEDMHWVDGETESFLKAFVESVPAARILLLVNYRPEYQHGWGGKSYYRQLRLDPLPAEAAGELLDALLGGDAALDRLKQLLATRTGGNPFFLEESVRTLVERGALIEEPGGYHLAKPLEDIQIPDTVQAILTSRIDRLPPEEKRLLQCASVIGKDVPFMLLREIADQPEEDLRRWLMDLQAAEFLYEASLFPDLEYTFKHALTHTVVYGSLLKDRRCSWHRAVVDAIERMHPDSVTENAEVLAHHALRSEDWAKAARYLRLGGKKAFARSARREAAGMLDESVKALARLPETREVLEQAIDVRLELRMALFSMGERQRDLECLQQAELMAERAHDLGRRGRVWMLLGHFYWGRGDLDRSVEFAERAVSLGKDLGDTDLRVVGNLTLAQASHARGDYYRAIELTRYAVASLEKDRFHFAIGGTSLPSVTNRTWLAWSLAEIGELAEAAERAEEGAQISEASGHLFSLFHASWILGVVRVLQGDGHLAIGLLEHGRQICQTAGIRFMENFAVVGLATAYAHVGRWQEAIEIIEMAIEQCKSMEMGFCRAMAEVHRGEAYLLADRVQEAKEFALQAIDLCRSIKARGYEAWGLKNLADIECQRGKLPSHEVESRYGEAMALAQELGMRPLVAHCHRGLGVLYGRSGDKDRGREQYGKAIDILRQCGADGGVEKYEKELAVLQI
jgi:class 3 adenylate cyclase/tetratricopeptide (TPR) repeat protein